MAEGSAPGGTASGRFSWGPRLLGPLVLIAVAIVVVVVAQSSLTTDESSTVGTGPAASPPSKETKKPDSGGKADAEKTYTVQAGDSLSTIAEETGVSVTDLEQLNPDVDPAALIEGQELKLR